MMNTTQLMGMSGVCLERRGERLTLDKPASTVFKL